ncbi:MAG: hypothetical protein ACXVB9_17285 [Bdellovibrionota bacterium]
MAISQNEILEGAAALALAAGAAGAWIARRNRQRANAVVAPVIRILSPLNGAKVQLKEKIRVTHSGTAPLFAFVHAGNGLWYRQLPLGQTEQPGEWEGVVQFGIESSSEGTPFKLIVVACFPGQPPTLKNPPPGAKSEAILVTRA